MSVLGKYQNSVGAQIEIVGYIVDIDVIGTVYKAIARDQLFGDRNILITPDGLVDAGYVKIETPSEPPC